MPWVGSAKWHVLQSVESHFLLSDVRSGTGCREIHVACPDGKVRWKCLLSRNPLPLWHGWFRAQPIPDDPLERTSCCVAEMCRQGIGRASLPSPGKSSSIGSCDWCCKHRKASGSSSQPPPGDPHSAAARDSLPPPVPAMTDAWVRASVVLCEWKDPKARRGLGGSCLCSHVVNRLLGDTSPAGSAVSLVWGLLGTVDTPTWVCLPAISVSPGQRHTGRNGISECGFKAKLDSCR